MIKLAKFEFQNKLAIGANENISSQIINDVSVRLFRIMRTTPMVGMKQPLLNSAIMGFETLMEASKDGNKLSGHKWMLSRYGRYVQRGIFDNLGRSCNILIGLYDIGDFELSIYKPIEKAKEIASCGSL